MSILLQTNRLRTHASSLQIPSSLVWFQKETSVILVTVAFSVSIVAGLFPIVHPSLVASS